MTRATILNPPATGRVGQPINITVDGDPTPNIRWLELLPDETHIAIPGAPIDSPTFTPSRAMKVVPLVWNKEVPRWFWMSYPWGWTWDDNTGALKNSPNTNHASCTIVVS